LNFGRNIEFVALEIDDAKQTLVPTSPSPRSESSIAIAPCGLAVGFRKLLFRTLLGYLPLLKLSESLSRDSFIRLQSCRQSSRWRPLFCSLTCNSIFPSSGYEWASPSDWWYSPALPEDGKIELQVRLQKSGRHLEDWRHDWSRI